jgi:hypothetical protein
LSVNYELYAHSCEDCELKYTPEWYKLRLLPWSIATSYHGYSASLNVNFELPYDRVGTYLITFNMHSRK